MALIDIEDTGPGLSDDEREHIFEPFTRANTPGVAAPGAGLGLTIAKMLTDLMGGELTMSSTPGVGSVFRVRLFLPEVRQAPGQAAPVPAGRRPRHGYAGKRRRILVVDNEEADRELLVNLLQPLGFEIRTAASGHDCLDLMAAGLQPDAILMDLAMPGIDGWETIRRLRALGGQSQPCIAIVSANAFDKGLDNDAGIRAEDFILKPVRHSELLDWLERQLQLRWLAQPAAAPVAPAAPAGALVWPAAVELQALRDMVSLGFVRGILNQLDTIEKAQPECAGFVAGMRTLAKQFQFEAMGRQLDTPAGAAE
jgi:CheY-like chemotaxis protein